MGYLSADLRDSLTLQNTVTLHLDLRPDLSEDVLSERLSKPRGSDSFANVLRKQLALPPVSIALLREAAPTLRSTLIAILKMR